MRLQESRNASLLKTFARFLSALKKQIVNVKITVRSWLIVLAITQVIIENIGFFENDCFSDTAAVRNTYGVL